MTVDGHCADSGGVLPGSFRVRSNNMPHPMGLVRAGDILGDRGFEVTAPIQSGVPIQALRPSTVSGLASSGGALHRSSSGPHANWPRDTQPEMIGQRFPEGAGAFFNGPVVSGMGQSGSRGGYPTEYRPLTTDEHRSWNLKLRADMIGRAALKARNSQHVQQRSVDYEGQLQEKHVGRPRWLAIVGGKKPPLLHQQGETVMMPQMLSLPSAIGEPIILHPRAQWRRVTPPLLLCLLHPQ